MTTIDLPLVLAALAVLAGSAVQGAVGFGMALLAAPFVMLLDPSLMPGSLLVVGGFLALVGYAREWRDADWRGLGWASVGRTVGSAAGAGLVALASPRLLGLLVGGVVLGVVLLTVRTVAVPVSRGWLLAAGAVSGVTGTATAIGGPPIALLYQHDAGPRVRATLGIFLLAGTVMSLGALAVGGELHARQVVAGALMTPFMAAGLAVSAPLRRRLDAGRLRWWIIGVAAASALALLARSIW